MRAIFVSLTIFAVVAAVFSTLCVSPSADASVDSVPSIAGVTMGEKIIPANGWGRVKTKSGWAWAKPGTVHGQRGIVQVLTCEGRVTDLSFQILFGQEVASAAPPKLKPTVRSFSKDNVLATAEELILKMQVDGWALTARPSKNDFTLRKGTLIRKLTYAWPGRDSGIVGIVAGDGSLPKELCHS